MNLRKHSSRMPTAYSPRAGEIEGGGGPCTRGRAGDLYSEIQVEQVWIFRSLYCEVQCIMGNSNMGSIPWTDRLSDTQGWKHYLPATSLARDNNSFLTLVNAQMLKCLTPKKREGRAFFGKSDFLNLFQEVHIQFWMKKSRRIVKQRSVN